MIVLLPTVKHTGTWFTIELLKPMVDNFVEVQVLIKNKTLPRKGSRAGLVDGRNLIHGHLTDAHLPMLEAFSTAWPVVVPLRDPLLSLITRKHRHPDQDACHVIDQWLNLLRLVEGCKPFYLPVDATDAPPLRLSLLCRMMEHLGIDWIEYDEYLWKIARDWAPVNGKGDYPLKKAYYAGDLRTIRAAMPKEYDYLRDLGDPIYRLLEDAWPSAAAAAAS